MSMMRKKNNIKRFSQIVLIFSFFSVLTATAGCDFLSGLFSKSDKEVKNAYMEYRKTFSAGDLESMKKFIAKDKLNEFEGEDAKKKLELARAFYPPNIILTGTNIKGNLATLTATSASESGTINGTIHMIKEDGHWKVYEEKWEMRFGESIPQGQASSGAGQEMQPQPLDATGKTDSDATGEAVIVKDGLTETYILKTGFFSNTRFKNPNRANIEFQIPAKEYSNARRIEITLDATKTGRHYADGKNYSVLDEDKVAVGNHTENGLTAIFKYVADGGQIFPPKDTCIINITSHYTGDPKGIFSGEVSNCAVHSAGIDYTISSVMFTMRGVPSH